MPGSDSGRRSRAALLPLYSLYGESSGATVDFIHIEPLRDRSELFDWSIDAHTHAGLHQVVLLFTGAVDVTLDEDTHYMAAPAVIAIPAGVVHSFEFEPHSSGFMLAIAEGQLEGYPMAAWLRSQLFAKGMTFALDEHDDLISRLEVLAAEIMSEQKTIETGGVATVDWLTRTVLVLVARQSEGFQQSGAAGHRGSDIFRDFQTAVEAHYAEHWSVGRYGQSLHISESSLNRLCQKSAGTTAFEIIKRRLEIEARRRLVYSTAAIQHIAGDLGFVDPSYFARFVKKRTGFSPREFRAQHQTMPPADSHERGVPS